MSEHKKKPSSFEGVRAALEVWRRRAASHPRRSSEPPFPTEEDQDEFIQRFLQQERRELEPDDGTPTSRS